MNPLEVVDYSIKFPDLGKLHFLNQNGREWLTLMTSDGYGIILTDREGLANFDLEKWMQHLNRMMLIYETDNLRQNYAQAINIFLKRIKEKTLEELIADDTTQLHITVES